jgi:hypothetical protein
MKVNTKFAISIQFSTNDILAEEVPFGSGQAVRWGQLAGVPSAVPAAVV